MTTKKKIFLVVGVIAIVLVLWGISSYNGLVSAREAVDTAWAQVETQYQRRFDLIPNLVETVKGIFNQEQSVFGNLAEARTRYAGAMTINEKVAAASEVESALARLLVVVENYPNLRSSESVQNLMIQLEGTENRVSVERKRFNDAVLAYNLKVKRFPSNLMASLFGFEERVYFEAAPEAASAPRVNF
jgi:LemA protein